MALDRPETVIPLRPHDGLTHGVTRSPSALRLAAAAFLFLASAAGVLPPLLAGSAGGDAHVVGAARLRAFSAGVMLSLSLLHLCADSFARLAEVSSFPWAGVAVLSGILFLNLVELFALEVSDAKNTRGSKGTGGEGSDDGDPECSAEAQELPALAAHAHGHSHGSAVLLTASPGGRKLLTAHLLEASVLVHSLVIGCALGVSDAAASRVAAMAGVLALHQFFEGCALGSIIADLGAAMPFRRKLSFAAAFCATTPCGVLLGVLAAPRAGEEHRGAGLVAGALDGVTGGMLLQMSMSMLGEELKPGVRRRELVACLLAGCVFMAVLAIWA